MKRSAIAAIFSVIATAKEQREHATLAQLMMLHDEMVQKLDADTNETSENLFDRLFSGDESSKQDQTTTTEVSVDVETQTQTTRLPREGGSQPTPTATNPDQQEPDRRVQRGQTQEQDPTQKQTAQPAQRTGGSD